MKMGKQRKRIDGEESYTIENHGSKSEVKLVNGYSCEEEKKKKKKKKKRKEEQKDVDLNQTHTVSIAVPGSIIDNTQSLELATRLAGQIARAATIFRIDEVIVIDNKSALVDESSVLIDDNNSDEYESGAAFLIRILRYLETPQYLRKSLFPKHNSLRFVGMLPPLDAPHHLRKHEWAPYREGVTLSSQVSDSGGTFVDVGLNKNVVIGKLIEPGRRVTVAMGTDRNLDTGCEFALASLHVFLELILSPHFYWQIHHKIMWLASCLFDDHEVDFAIVSVFHNIMIINETSKGLTYQVVPSSTPRDEAGMYWGYKVRYASNISAIFSGCPHERGYDYLIGTSEHGVIVRSSELSLPPFRHLLIAFGGLAGLEECIEEDNELKGKNVREIFDLYLNTCPHQGSRTIRTEEAILISLQYFQEPISRVLT